MTSRVHASCDAIHVCVAVQLPQRPGGTGPQEETAEPQRSVELVPDRVRALEVVADVQHHLSAPCLLDRDEEVLQLLGHIGCTRPGAAVAYQLEVDGRRERVRVRGATSRKC